MIHRVIQGSAEWFDLKCGKVTSCRVDDAIAVLKRKDGEAAARRNLKAKIVSERFTGKHTDSYVSHAMEWGAEWEKLARTEYEQKTGNDVRLVGFVDHPTIEMAGASPDGLIGDDGCIEIKCPQSNTHIDYLIARTVPVDYQPQCLWVMACAEREWCDFVSFDPRMPKKHQLLIVRMWRDEKRIKEMNEAVIQFLAEVDDLVRQLEAGENYYINQLAASIEAVKGQQAPA